MLEKLTSAIRDLVGSENEMVQSAEIAIQDRITSPFYGYFVISWLLLNWRILYIAFFVDQDKIFQKTGLLRSEYLNTVIPPHVSWYFVGYFVLFPFVLTVFFFWGSPYITRLFFRKHIRNQKHLKLIELQESREVKKEEKALIHAEAALTQEKAEKVKREKKIAIETPEVVWEKDFKTFQSTKIFDKFDQIVSSIYSKRGLISGWEENIAEEIDFIDRDLLVYADSNELIQINENTIHLTPKGKFFVKKFSELENQL